MISFPFLPVEGLHEFNLDWFLNKFRELLDEWEVTKAAWLALKEYVENFFDNLDVQEEINNKLDEMLAAGDFTPIFNTLIPIFVDRWLNDNIESVTTASIDRSMQSTVLSAAAFDLGTAYTSILPYISAKRGFSDIDEIGGINENGVNTNNRKFVRSHLIFVDTNQCNRITWNLDNALWGNYEYRVFYYREVNGQNTFIGSTPYKSLDTESLAGEGMKYKILLHKKDDANMDETDLAYANNNLILYRNSNGSQIVKDRSVALNQTVAVVAENSVQSIVGGDLDSWQQGQLGTQNSYRVSYRQLIKLAPAETLTVYSNNCLNYCPGIYIFKNEGDYPNNTYDLAEFATSGTHSYYNDTNDVLYCHVVFRAYENDVVLTPENFLADCTPFISRLQFNDYDNVGRVYQSRHVATINSSGNNYAGALEGSGGFASEYITVKEGDVIMCRVIDRLNRTDTSMVTYQPYFIYAMFNNNTLVARRVSGYSKTTPYNQKNIYFFVIPEGVNKIACAAYTHYTNEFEVSNLSDVHNNNNILIPDNFTCGHRGMRYWGEDNDITGIINALKSGVRVIELDVSESSDGVLYASHDDTVTIFGTSTTLTISDTTSEVLDSNLYEASTNVAGQFYYKNKGRKLWRLFDLLRLFKPWDVTWAFDVKYTVSFTGHGQGFAGWESTKTVGIPRFINFIQGLEMIDPTLDRFMFSVSLVFARNRFVSATLLNDDSQGMFNKIKIQPWKWFSAETLSSRLARLDGGTMQQWAFLDQRRYLTWWTNNGRPLNSNIWYFMPHDTLILTYEWESDQNYARADELITAMYDTLSSYNPPLLRDEINIVTWVFNTLIADDNYNLMMSCNSLSRITSDRQPAGLVCSDKVMHLIDELN